MKRLLLSVIVCCSVSLQSAFAGSEVSAATEYEFRHQGDTRTYWLYVPDCLREDAPLVFVLHGYSGSAKGYRPEMLETAEKYGFAVCCPQGAIDARGKNCWNVGYPFQEGLKTDDVDFLCDLAKFLQRKHGFRKSNTFLTGMSNGGEMCYLMAAVRPDAFAAYAPIAGLTMEWSYKKHAPRKAVPLMEVHGTKDMTSDWNGDPTNAGGWGEYISVPLAVGLWAAEARCTHVTDVELPQKGNKVILHRYLGGVPAWKNGPAVEVRLYEIVGGKHKWGLSDMDTCEEIWKFFSMYLR